MTLSKNNYFNSSAIRLLVIGSMVIGMFSNPVVGSAAVTIRVPQDQPTIQAAINAAQNGDVVLVSPGLYSEQLTISGKTITLASQFYTTGDSQYIASTIIDGQPGTPITVDATVGPQTKIIGLTIRNGIDGIKTFSKLQILNNHIYGNVDGVDMKSAGGVISGNIVENNTDDGLDSDGATDVIIENNIIRNNTDDGFEIRLNTYNGPLLNIIIRGNTFIGNREDGIQLIDYPDVTNRVFYIEGNIIANSTKVGLGLMDAGITHEDYRAASIPERIYVFNNTFVGNPYGLTGGNNLIALNNLFVNSTVLAMKDVDTGSIAAYNLFWNNTANHLGSNVDANTTLYVNPLLDANYALQAGSPAIDAGTAQFVWNTETVLDLAPGTYSGSAPDLGENDYNFSSVPTPTPAANTPTSTKTPTNTPLPPATSTPTRTATQSPVVAATATRTATYTPIAPATSTSTPTRTATNTPVISATSSPIFTASPDTIFVDGFESGGLSAWSSSSIDAGDLSVNPAAALYGVYGMQTLLDDINKIYVTDERPLAEARYRARFYLDPNSVTMLSGEDFYIFQGYASTAVVRVKIAFAASGYQLMASILNDGTTWAYSSLIPITDAPHFVELDWKASSAVGANNGGLTFWVDGVQRANLTNIDNDTRRIDRVQLGAVTGIDAGTRGTIFFDTFESRRQSYIGPDSSSPMTNTPTPLVFTSTPTRTPTPGGDPILVGAGDIAACDSTGDEATANLLDFIGGTVYTTGDNVYPNGTTAEFANCYDTSWGRHKSRTFPSAGNHEYNTAGATGYFNYFGAAAGDPAKGYYSYDLGAWHVIVLNSNIPVNAGSAQEQWLRADLAAHPVACTVAYWHFPLFSSSGSNPTMRPLWQALYDFDADVVLVGHEHNYERFAPQNPAGIADPAQGIRQFVIGTGGRSLYPIGTPMANSEVHNDNTYGVLKLTLHPNSYDWEFIPEAGMIFTDSGSAPCVAAAPVTQTTTPTRTATNTPLPSATSTLTHTPIATFTKTATPVNTSTSIPTSTRTPTPVFTQTPSNTPVASVTPTQTKTSTPTSGPPPSVTATPSDVIFIDGFESGSLSAWSSSVIDAGDLSVSPGAALFGGYGLRTLIDDNLGIYVTDDRPNAAPRYRARFYFDPNSIPMVNGDDFYLFQGYASTTTAVVRAKLAFTNGGYQLMVSLLNDSTTWIYSSLIPITDAPHFVELDWTASSAVGANNGGLTFWIDGVQQASIASVDNDTRRIDRIQLGAVTGINTGTRGSIFIDAFESRLQTYIGP